MQIYKTFSIFLERLLLRNGKVKSFQSSCSFKSHEMQILSKNIVNVRIIASWLTFVIIIIKKMYFWMSFLRWSIFAINDWILSTSTARDACETNIMCARLTFWVIKLNMSRWWLVVRGNVIFCRTIALAEFSFPWQTFQSAADTYKSKTKSDFDFKSQSI